MKLRCSLVVVFGLIACSDSSGGRCPITGPTTCTEPQTLAQRVSGQWMQVYPMGGWAMHLQISAHDTTLTGVGIFVAQGAQDGRAGPLYFDGVTRMEPGVPGLGIPTSPVAAINIRFKDGTTARFDFGRLIADDTLAGSVVFSTEPDNGYYVWLARTP
jgi:hypothetical protein